MAYRYDRLWNRLVNEKNTYLTYLWKYRLLHAGCDDADYLCIGKRTTLSYCLRSHTLATHARLSSSFSGMPILLTLEVLFLRCVEMPIREATALLPHLIGPRRQAVK